MTPMQSTTSKRFWRCLPWAAALLLAWAATAAFGQEADPPGRVAHLSYRQGSVVFAPQGEDEWLELPQNRPLTAGDRLWSDRGARAELQLGTATLHLDGQSHFGIGALDDGAAQFIVQQGRVQARVRELQPGENFEIGTPNLALRALQPGEYRLDVDSSNGETQVTVLSGMAALFGEGGQTLNLGTGQRANFVGRELAQVPAPNFRPDDFGQWAAERNRQEDQSIAARYVPRGVVGYPDLDQHGVWSQDASLGAVWYPRVDVAEWAPYRYGHWSWIQPWGWTWIDDAPWGFAPFHYGRWTMLGNRWAWVPGRMGARPVYAPALVVFLGGGAGRFSIDSGPGVGWYPLAPGEAWWPTYRSSPRYVSHLNHNINLDAYPRHYANHMWRQRPSAVTAVREEDFRRGRPVVQNWQRVQPQMLGQAQAGVVPARPEGRWDRGAQASPPRLLSAPAVGVQPSVPAARMWSGREAGRDPAPLVREQQRAQFEQQRLQREAERVARDQQRQQELARRQQDSQRFQQDQVMRQQQQLQQQQQVQRQQAEAARHEAWQRQRAAPAQSQQPAQLYRVQPSPPPAAQPAQPREEPRGGRWQRDADGEAGRGPRGHRGRD
jgi:hypothetical protein